MKKKTSLSEEDQALFRQLMTGTRKIKQDTIVHRPQRKKVTEVAPKRLLQEQADNSHYFSDEFQPLLNTEGSTKYVRADVSHFELKKLRRGDYSPELFLDLHGLTQQQAKQELGALIAACRREHVFCACVMHGHGKHILKQQTPLWLAQHPHIMAFHQAPKEYGGDAALLVLIEVEEWQPPGSCLNGGLRGRQMALAILRLQGLFCQRYSPLPSASSVTQAIAEVVNIGGVSPGHSSETRYPTSGRWETTSAVATPSFASACR